MLELHLEIAADDLSAVVHSLKELLVQFEGDMTGVEYPLHSGWSSNWSAVTYSLKEVSA